jgi:hypothetical protein
MLARSQIISLLNELDRKLSSENITGELYLLGGAVFCLVFNARASTKNIDAVFLPKSKIRKFAEEIACANDLPSGWLNDAVKGFLSKDATYTTFGDFTSLKVYTATPEYLLSMKCLSMRLGEEFHDIDDVRFLLRYLNITTYGHAIEIIADYYPLEMFPQKTLYALEEILS